MTERISSHKKENVHEAPGFVGGGGEMGSRIFAHDWSRTSLGPIADWPQSLQHAVRMMLLSPAAQVILWGTEGIALYNDAYISIAGGRHPHLLGNSCVNIWPEIADFINNVISRCLQGESLSFKRHMHRVYRNENPEDVWMDLFCSPITDDRGCPAGVFIINIETTQYILAEQTYQKGEARLKQIVAGTNDGIWEYNLETESAQWNDRLWEIIGYTPEEVEKPGYHFLQSITHPEDKEKVRDTFIRTCNEGRPFHVEYRVQHRKGHYVHLHAKAKPVYDEQGRLISIAGITTDITERKNTELSLINNEERLRGIFNQSSVGIAETDLNGKFVLVNDKYSEMIGLSKEALYQLRMQDISHADDLENNIYLFNRAVSKGAPFKIEKRYLRPDGTHIWVNNSVSLIKDSKGRPLSIVAVCLDITDRKRAEEAVLESEQRFRTLADASGILIAHTDDAGNAIYFNKEWLKLTGRSMEELIIYGWADLLHPADRQGFIDAYKQAVEKIEPLQREFRLLTKEGDYRWQLAILSPRIGPHGDYAGHVSSCIDITERKHAEEALKEREQRFRILADAAPYMVWAVKPDFTTLYVNKFTLEFIGLTYDQFPGNNWAPYVHPDDVEITNQTARDAVENRKIYTIEQRLLRHDGEYRWMLTQGAPSYYPNGELFGYVGSCIDITLRKEAEKELEQKNIQLLRTNNDLDNFIYTASHDLRSPIVNLDGLLMALSKRLAPTLTPEAKTLLNLMNTSIQRLNKTIKDLAEITKAQKALEETIEEVSFEEMLEDIKTGLLDEIQDISPTIIKDFQVTSIRYLAGSLRSIMYNLFSNALKYRSEARSLEIKVKTYRCGEDVVLSVSDNGLGMNEQQIPKLFNMFRRLHTHVEGTGIGLYIIKRIVENNGGKIEVSSKPGIGSTFTVYLHPQS